MNRDDFDLYLRAVHGYSPYPWQRRLLGAIVEGAGFPRYIQLPTGSGKTTILDIAVFALALCAERQQVGDGPCHVPRRIFYVIDRRIVVDQASRVAQRIRTVLELARPGRETAELDRELATLSSQVELSKAKNLLQEMSRRLLHLAGAHGDRSADERGRDRGAAPLAVGVMRGGLEEERFEWVRSPLQPLICCTTVDQIGSRMLFRGYGLARASRNALSVHAAMTALDSLIILDEAHLSRAFARTAEAVAQYATLSEASLSASWPRPASIVEMSATLCPGDEDGNVFTLNEEDWCDATLSSRLESKKLTQLVEVGSSSADQMTDNSKQDADQKALVSQLVDQALRVLREDESVRSLAVVVNRVRTARDVAGRLHDDVSGSQAGWSDIHVKVILLTGRQRPFDRTPTVEDIEAFFQTEPNRGGEHGTDARMIVVATQCIEVGADYDFDALVTESASYDALCQRFGRCNRSGRRPVAHAVIVHIATRSSADDPIYGDALLETWHWLMKAADKPKGKKGMAAQIDFSHRAIQARSQSVPSLQRMMPRRLAPPMLLPVHLDLLSQTSPIPSVPLNVSLFLHGHTRASADISIAWRADLVEGQTENWPSVIIQVPPKPGELLQIPIWEARRWLVAVRGGVTALDSMDGGDVEGALEPDDPPSRGPCAPYLLWRGADDDGTRVMTEASDLRPGDLIVVPSTYGGIRNRNWDPTSIATKNEQAAVPDVADAILHRGMESLRLSWPVVQQRAQRCGMQVSELEALQAKFGKFMTVACELLPGTDFSRDAIRELPADVIGHWLSELPAPAQREHGRLAAQAEADDSVFGNGSRLLLDPTGSGLVIWISANERETKRRTLTWFVGDDDDSALSATLSLEQHTQHVVNKVMAWSRELGLSADVESTLRAAARWHDIGKAYPPFQTALHQIVRRTPGRSDMGGTDKALLAKAAGYGRPGEVLHALASAGVAEGFRHEAMSIALLMSCPAEAKDDLRMHLIASHHGCARPFLPIEGRGEPPDLPVEYESAEATLRCSSRHELWRVDSGVANRFWALQQKHGWYGLAWLETLLRLADWSASADEVNLPGGEGP
jgi:CRISPR-associated endonuclease/helicase Cas3